MFPAFRVTLFKRDKSKQQVIKVKVLEPGFYWRVQRDYEDAPPPTIVLFDPRNDNLDIIAQKITRARTAATAAAAALSSSSTPSSNMLSSPLNTASRIVLQASVPHYPAAQNVIPRTLQVTLLFVEAIHTPVSVPPFPFSLFPFSPLTFPSLHLLFSFPSLPPYPPHFFSLPSPPLSLLPLQSIKASSQGHSVQSETSENIIERTTAWAQDSVGLYANFTSYGNELLRYGQLPSLKAGESPSCML